MALKPKKRRLRARYCVGMDERVNKPSAILINSKGRVVNAINGGAEHTVASVRAAAKKWWPEAAEVAHRGRFGLK